MREESSILSGHRILILEDNYLLAFDVESALISAGAEVVGPFAQEAAAIEAISQNHLSAAITDINLGAGPSFKTAEALRAAQVPFIFLTGYERSEVPDQFAGTPCVVKPFITSRMVSQLAQLLQSSKNNEN